MTESRTGDQSLAPRRSLSGAAEGDAKRPVLPPPPPELTREREAKARKADKPAEQAPGSGASSSTGSTPAVTRTPRATKPARPARASRTRPAKARTRKARLRLVQVDAWSVMKTAFLLSIAIGIVTIVAVLIVWSVLGAAGVWTSINSIVQQALGSENGTPFEIQKYLGTSRIMGLTMILAVLDVILITAIATLSAFLYNLAAALLGGVEVTFAEDH